MNKAISWILILVILVLAGWYMLSYDNVSAPQVADDFSLEFGDDGDEGGTVAPLSLDLGDNLLGKWQSTDDAKFVREFKTGGVSVDSYEGKATATDTWQVFTKESPLEVPFTIEAGTLYVQIAMGGSGAETLNFKVSKMTPEELELIYMDRGGALNFTKIAE